MRGRLIFAFLAELHRLGSAAVAGAGLAGGYDPDFKEPMLRDIDGDGLPEPYRLELPPVLVPCQVETEALEALRMTSSGDTPRSSLDLVFHFRDLERLKLVDPGSGAALIRPGDRLGALKTLAGELVQAIRTPPGLYVTEARPSGFGLRRGHSSRNLLVVSFQDHPVSRSFA